MTKVHLTQLWQWLSVACVLFLVTSIIQLQGGSDYVGRLFGSATAGPTESKPAIGYFAVIIGAGLFLLASAALFLHVWRHGDKWHERIPVVWLVGLDTGAWEAKIFQAAVLLILVVAPAVGIIRCVNEAEKGQICEQDTQNVYEGSDSSLLWAPVAKNNGNQMRLRKAEAGNEPCKSGVELFPRSLTPAGIYGLPIAAGGLALLAIVCLFVPRRPRPLVDTSPEG